MVATASIKKVFRSIYVVLEVFVKVLSKPTPDLKSLNNRNWGPDDPEIRLPY